MWIVVSGGFQLEWNHTFTEREVEQSLRSSKKRVLSKLDLLSLDIEGLEAAALRGVDFERFSIDYLCIETSNVNEISQLLSSSHEMLEMISHHDYVFRRRGVTK